MPKENDLEGKRTWAASTWIRPACRNRRSAAQQGTLDKKDQKQPADEDRAQNGPAKDVPKD